MPYFDGLMAGEPGALVESFAGEPEVHDPVRGRIKGARAFEAFVAETNDWLAQRNVSVEDVEHVVTDRAASRRSSSTSTARADESICPSRSSPTASPTDGSSELRIYYSGWQLTGRHANRPPLLQPDPELRESDVVAEYQRALAAGDVEAIVAAFEPDGYARSPPAASTSTGAPTACAPSTSSCSRTSGGIPLEHCCADRRRAARARWSTTSCGGAARSCRRKPGSPSTCAARAASSRRPHLRRRRPAARPVQLTRPRVSARRPDRRRCAGSRR